MGSKVNTTTWASWLGIKTFDDPALIEMVNQAARWATDLKAGASPHWLVLLGNSGVGKTHVAKRLWKWIQTRPDFAASGAYVPDWIYWPIFVDELRSGGSYGRLADMTHWNYLAIDDVASERVSEFSGEKLHNLLGSRVGKWTIITSNKSMRDIADFDVRIASRLERDGSKIIDARAMDYSVRRRRA